MKQKVAEMVLKDFSSDASGYFNSIRIPASLVAGSALGALFSLNHKFLKNHSSSPIERFLVRSYHALVLTSFSLSLFTIVLTTAAAVNILHARFDPKAETAYAMLRREFDFEFCLTHWCFLISLLCFILGITIRVILEFGLLAPHRRPHLGALLSVSTAIVANWLSYINRTMYSWSNLFDLTCYVFALLIRSAWEGRNLLQMTSVLAGASAFGFMLYILLDLAAPFDLDEDDDKKEGEKKKSG